MIKSHMTKSASIRPPQSPSQSRKLYVYLLIRIESLSSSISKLVNLYLLRGSSAVGNLVHDVNLGASLVFTV